MIKFAQKHTILKSLLIGCLILLQFNTTATAQEVPVRSKLHLSTEMKEPSNATIDDFLGEDENGFYVLRKKINNSAVGFFGSFTGFIIESYSNDLLLKKRQELSPAVDGMIAEMDMVKYLDGRLVAYFTYVNRKEGKTELYYQLIDKKTLLLSGTPIKIAAIAYSTRSRQGEFRYQPSTDRNKIAIIAALHDEKQFKETFTTSVYDGSMQLLWSKDITLPYESELFEREKLLLDNNGNQRNRGERV